jgi:hypothetical protein
MIRDLLNGGDIEIALLLGALSWALFMMFEKVKDWLRFELNLCEVCLTFWIVILLTFNPMIAAGAAMVKWWVEKNDDIKL